eukprot:XP_023973422.1 uncharacterized protein LOC112062664 isoform X2 [Physeter catodon]
MSQAMGRMRDCTRSGWAVFPEDGGEAPWRLRARAWGWLVCGRKTFPARAPAGKKGLCPLLAAPRLPFPPPRTVFAHLLSGREKCFRPFVLNRTELSTYPFLQRP